MEIKTYSPSEQVDPAVDLGVIPPPLPDIEFLRDFAASVPAAAPPVAEEVVRRPADFIRAARNWCEPELF